MENSFDIRKNNISFRVILKLIFVVFFVYLLGDAFYRWDGFRFYSTFSEFLPSVALISVVWSIMSVITAVFIWLTLTVAEWLFLKMRLRISMDFLLLLILFSLFMGMMFWVTKKIIWQNLSMTFQFKVILWSVLIFIAVLMAWLFRRHLDLIQESITPLAALFGIWVIMSLSLVVYHTWIKAQNSAGPQMSHSQVKSNGPNIIVIIFDTLRAENMSVYDYERNTTPFINEWAKEATIFNRAYAESNMTAPTISSLLTGKRVWSHQVYQPHGSLPLKSKTESLPNILKDNGYYNLAFVANFIATVDAMGVAESFDFSPDHRAFTEARGTIIKNIEILFYNLFVDKITLHDWLFKTDFIFSRVLKRITEDFNETRFPVDLVFNKFLESIEEKPQEPYFAWIHLRPPHAKYLPTARYMGMYDSSPELRTWKSQFKGIEEVSKYTSSYSIITDKLPDNLQATMNALKARYDEFIRYCDDQFREFVHKLEKKNMLQNTVIILTSDHGESFEHNYLEHGGYHLYEQVTNIPLIIRRYNNSHGRIVNDIIEQVDIPPTILDLAGIEIPSWFEGKSLVPLMNGEKIQPTPAISMNFERNPSKGNKIKKGSIAVWEGQYKLIYYIERNESLLFNIKHDPYEKKNIVNKEKEIAERLLSFIKKNLEKANEKINDRL